MLTTWKTKDGRVFFQATGDSRLRVVSGYSRSHRDGYLEVQVITQMSTPAGAPDPGFVVAHYVVPRYLWERGRVAWARGEGFKAEQLTECSD